MRKLSPAMSGGEHYFGVNDKRYMTKEGYLHESSSLTTGTNLLRSQIDPRSLGGQHDFARRDSGKNYVYKVDSTTFTRFDSVADFKAEKKGTTKDLPSVARDATYFYGEGDYIYFAKATNGSSSATGHRAWPPSLRSPRTSTIPARSSSSLEGSSREPRRSPMDGRIFLMRLRRTQAR